MTSPAETAATPRDAFTCAQPLSVPLTRVVEAEIQTSVVHRLFPQPFVLCVRVLRNKLYRVRFYLR